MRHFTSNVTDLNEMPRQRGGRKRGRRGTGGRRKPDKVRCKKKTKEKVSYKRIGQKNVKRKRECCQRSVFCPGSLRLLSRWLSLHFRVLRAQMDKEADSLSQASDEQMSKGQVRFCLRVFWSLTVTNFNSWAVFEVHSKSLKKNAH